MPRTVTLEDGTELELPDNVVQDFKNEGIEEIKQEYGDPAELKEQLDAKEDAVTKLQEEVRIAAEKGQNASELRKKLQDAEKVAEEAKKAAEGASSQSNNLLIDEWKDKAISQLTDDPETRKVFEAKYQLLANMPSGTKAEIQSRIDAALDLTQPGWRGGMDTSAFSSESARGGKPKDGGAFNEAQKDVAAQLGISPDAIEKYGKEGINFANGGQNG